MEVEIKQLSKSYDGHTYALHEVSLRVGPGITGLVGPNGAGKTTLMRLLATLLKPSSGSIHYDMHDIIAEPMFARHHLGYLPQDFGLYPQLTAANFLDFLACLDGVQSRAVRQQKVTKALETVHLFTHARERLGTFSGGMRQRIGIAQALMREPSVLILDEPTAGLDPAERQEFHSMLAVLGATTTILLSSHILSDVTSICSQVFVIAGGTLKASGAVQDLLHPVTGRIFDCLVSDDQMAELARTVRILANRREENGLHVRIYTSQGNVLPPNARPVPPTLDDAYLILTGSST
jgi:ABC-2 type transport system ATP-binding protein